MSSRAWRIVILIGLVLAGAVAAVYAVEADKEVRILCGLFKPGTPEAEMDRIIGTANLLRVEETREDERKVREVYSRVNLGRNGCRVTLAEGEVVQLQVRDGFWGLGKE